MALSGTRRTRAAGLPSRAAPVVGDASAPDGGVEKVVSPGFRVVEPEDFTRGYLQAGHASASPGNLGDNNPVAPGMANGHQVCEHAVTAYNANVAADTANLDQEALAGIWSLSWPYRLSGAATGTQPGLADDEYDTVKGLQDRRQVRLDTRPRRGPGPRPGTPGDRRGDQRPRTVRHRHRPRSGQPLTSAARRDCRRRP